MYTVFDNITDWKIGEASTLDEAIKIAKAWRKKNDEPCRIVGPSGLVIWIDTDPD